MTGIDAQLPTARLPLLAEASLPIGVAAQRSEEVDLPESRPVHVAEVELRVGALPQEEVGEALFAACADDQIRIGLTLRL